jgi:hypothetical protein
MKLEWLLRLLQPGSRELTKLQRRYRMKVAARSIVGDWLYNKLWTGMTRKEPDADIGTKAPDEDPADHQ